MRWRVGSLSRNLDFLKLWSGQTISLFGSEISELALPLTAVLVLQATPIQMGLLGVARFVPFLLVTLLAGVWIDRRRRRPILIAADAGRGVLVALVPLLAIAGMLRIEHLYIVAFMVGVLSVFFELAYQAFLPSLVEREQVIEGNSKLQASASATAVGGPGLAGLLIEIVSAPVALLIDAFSFLISAVSLSLIRKPEPEPLARRPGESLLRQIGEGLRVVFGNPYLRAFVGEAASFNGMANVIAAVVSSMPHASLG
ncbi:MAG: hypothetical protein KatS3mg057_0526 [Herpetosiphonaceae bacterium]|nr:MAG: hypothetical protein KatS3mg057_0526 [Herpetosiphonaceae bacterium]